MKKSKQIKERDIYIVSTLKSTNTDSEVQKLAEKFHTTKKHINRIFSKLNSHPEMDKHIVVHTKDWWKN